MTRMLASVSNCFEVEKLIMAQVDIIDIKDPTKGALGAVSLQDAKKIIKQVNHRLPVSVTIGDITEVNQIDNAITNTATTGADIIKIGVFTDHLDKKLISILQKHCLAGLNLVLVFFADIGFSIYQFGDLDKIGIKGVMLDTANKSAGSIRSILDDHILANFIMGAHQNNLIAGLAGSLRVEDIAPLLKFSPDYLGFRGALCSQQQRTSEIDTHAVKQIRRHIPVHAGSNKYGITA